MKWLDVKKSLPANPGWVITCYDGYHGAELCWYESYCFYIKHKTKYHKKIYGPNGRSLCTHWMFLPTPVGLNNSYNNEIIKVTDEIKQMSQDKMLEQYCIK